MTNSLLNPIAERGQNSKFQYAQSLYILGTVGYHGVRKYGIRNLVGYLFIVSICLPLSDNFGRKGCGVGVYISLS